MGIHDATTTCEECKQNSRIYDKKANQGLDISDWNSMLPKPPPTVEAVGQDGFVQTRLQAVLGGALTFKEYKVHGYGLSCIWLFVLIMVVGR